MKKLKRCPICNRSWIIPVLIVTVNAIAIMVQWGSLPEVLLAHFDLQGNASGSMPRGTLLVYPLIGAVICLIAFGIAHHIGKRKKEAGKLQILGLTILTSGIVLTIFSSTMVTLTAGKMPIFMLAEPIILLFSVVAFVICLIKASKRNITLPPASGFSFQTLPVKGIMNARDLGNYTVQDGRHVRSGLLIRSAHLAEANEADLQHLTSLQTVKVVDFRMELEKKGKVDKKIPGAQYICLPIDGSGTLSSTASEKEMKKFFGRKTFNVKKLIVMAAFNSNAKTIARELYPTLLFNLQCQSQMAVFLRELVNTDGGAVLFHCTQGKDRTGIASALVLAALGVDRETIVKDFDATNIVYGKDVKRYTRRVRLLGGKEEEIAVVKAFIGANTENFIKALDAIDAQYGSMEAYLKGPMTLTENDIITLRNRYLTD